MTEFTSEYISNWRNAIKVVAGVRGDIREVEKFSLEALDEIERLQKRVDELEATISNQSKLVYKFKNMASDLQSENDFLKNNPEAEKYYYQKWMEGKQRIAELEQERRWIPVGERLPENGERVLVRMSNFYIVIACYFYKNGYWKNDSGQEIFIVTHWQPLPQPPKDGE